MERIPPSRKLRQEFEEVLQDYKWKGHLLDAFVIARSQVYAASSIGAGSGGFPFSELTINEGSGNIRGGEMVMRKER